jgi:HAD superfamily hydrolase (TIGR01484 family)
MPEHADRSAMRPLSAFPAAARRRIRLVLTDIDDTLTFVGRLSADTYAALERLERAGIAVVPVTAAPAGWCDLIARFWPVRAVIGENGGFSFRRDADPRAILRDFWLDEEARASAMARLAEIADTILAAFPDARTAADQPFRQTSWAIEPGTPETADRIAAAWRDAGARSTINSLWALGWFGAFDKLAMALRLGREVLGVDLETDRDAVVYVGDSLNDEPMFRFFPHAVGVATVRASLDRLDALPAYVTDGPGGAGFVELADALLAAR